MSASIGRETAIYGVLRRAGIPRDGALMVHSAFRHPAREGFRPRHMVEALAEYMSAGTLALPTMSWRYVTPAKPVFDELTTPSNTGILTEIFRTDFASHRSLHPTHSIAAVGALASRLTDGHHLDDTPCSLRSPFGRLAEMDGWVLMMGIGMDCCTLIHHAEELVAPHMYLRPSEQTETYTCHGRNGHEVQVRLRRHLFLPRDYFQFQNQLAVAGELKIDLIGSTVCRLYRARDMVAACVQSLERDPAAVITKPGGRYRMM